MHSRAVKMFMKKYQPKIQALITSGFMSFVVSGIIMYINIVEYDV